MVRGQPCLETVPNPRIPLTVHLGVADTRFRRRAEVEKRDPTSDIRKRARGYERRIEEDAALISTARRLDAVEEVEVLRWRRRKEKRGGERG